MTYKVLKEKEKLHDNKKVVSYAEENVIEKGNVAIMQYNPHFSVSLHG